MLRSLQSPDLERQLLRRSVMALSAGRDTCDGCHRTPLLGERVHRYEGGRTLCELCKRERREQPVDSRVVHGGEHGTTVRITDQRPERERNRRSRRRTADRAA
ncbi:hypothetical protein VSS74_07655 [Conexibacter stalactiti]|jgi:hypothetical protein|uniref:GATA-type domain-containing protein n=1 Tax=Conexibacter stalactiti TaxID=1940611 RepID=A0ABU4HLM4_9ACTN|nr:hypothetical protein [Conexibacter stalactiti]MDW5594205.1 hypothetical protein [Conexibacter stalactiti]MEC5034847.1 hypothetical protein [Conexibacter stalactiti]HST42022.1 hypothetical protein [Conexibacter sp.]